eukprot:Skav211462  [mRNA]  locus=scaffold379:253851:257128:+ [translate_table: standard]
MSASSFFRASSLKPSLRTYFLSPRNTVIWAVISPRRPKASASSTAERDKAVKRQSVSSVATLLKRSMTVFSAASSL